MRKFLAGELDVHAVVLKHTDTLQLLIIEIIRRRAFIIVTYEERYILGQIIKLPCFKVSKST